MTLEFKKSLRIFKKRNVDSQDPKTSKEPKPKSKRLRAPTRPNLLTKVEKPFEGTSQPSKGDKSPASGDKTIAVREGASIETADEGSNSSSFAQKKKGKKSSL